MLEITARSLTKDFGAVHAVQDVSFDIRPGRVIGFLGPNGSGKTTTLRMLLGLVRPTSGRILIGGRSYRELDHPARTVGAVLEVRTFHAGRTARDHLRVLAREARCSRQRVDDVLTLVELEGDGDRRAGGFSLGMSQRLALAGALLADPPVLILDEPTNGLDPAGIHWLRGLLRGLAGEGRTVIVSSHALAEIQRSADEVLILDRGRLLAHRTLASITSLEDEFLEITRPKELST